MSVKKIFMRGKKIPHLMINNSLVADRDLDVEELYKNSVMSK